MNKNNIVLALIFILPLITFFYVSNKNKSSITVSSTVKPQIIKFSSSLCGECQKMNTVLNQVYPKYKTEIELINIPVDVKNDYNESMIKKYNVTLVPTIILLDKDKEVEKRIVGAIDANTFEDYLRELK